MTRITHSLPIKLFMLFMWCTPGVTLLRPPHTLVGVGVLSVGLLVFARYSCCQISWDDDLLTYRSFFNTRKIQFSTIQRYTVEQNRGPILRIYATPTGSPVLRFHLNSFSRGDGALLLEKVRQGYWRRQVLHELKRKQDRRGVSRIKQVPVQTAAEVL